MTMCRTNTENTTARRFVALCLLAGLMGFGMLTIGSAPLASAATSTPAPTGPTKADVLSRLKAIQTKQTNEIQSIDDALRKRFGETTQIDMHQQSARLSDRRITQLAGHVEDLTQRRNELTARRDFMNMLIFTVDTKWNGQNFNKFLEFTFLDMAMNQISDARSIDASSDHLWKFLTYASICVREVPEPHEDVINVLESYINFSSLLEPKSPAIFLAGRSYTNGSMSYSAKGVPADKVGDMVDKQIRALNADARAKHRPVAKDAADIQLRLPPIPLPSTDSRGTTSGATSGGSSSSSTPAPEPTIAPVPPARKRRNDRLTPPPISNEADPTNGTSNPPLSNGQPSNGQNN